MTGEGEQTRIMPQEPVDLDSIAQSGQCFRWQKLAERTYRIPYRDRCVTVSQQDTDELVLNCTREEFDRVWRGYFDLDTDYHAIQNRIDPEKDPFLTEAMVYEGSLRILRQDPFEMLITSVIMQNRNIPAIMRSVEELARRAGEKQTAYDGAAFYTFPTAEAILSMKKEDLDACRLGYRDRYVCCAAQAVREGTVDLERLKASDPDTVMNTLMSVCGIGKKVACCIRLFGLHDLDAFPVDVWMQRIIGNEYSGNYPMTRYAPYNGIYQQYMFAYYRKRETGGKGK